MRLRSYLLIALLVAPLAGAAPFVVVSGPRGGSSGGGSFDPGNLLFLDGQEYTLGPDDSDYITTLQSAGWATAKASNGVDTWTATPPIDGSVPFTSGTGAGFLYTVEPEDIAEFGGVIPHIPGVTAERALMIEEWSAAYARQAEPYVQYGTPGGTRIGDIWIQFWYFQESSTTWNLQEIHDGKFIYPSKNNTWSTSPANGDWIFGRLGQPKLPWVLSGGNWRANDHWEKYAGARQTNIQVYPSTDAVASGISDRSGHIDYTRPMEIGVWQHIRLHFNTSEAAVTGERHLWEMYIRDYGDPDFVLVTRWEQGQPPQADNASVIPDPVLDAADYALFDWNVDVSTIGYGHNGFQIPSNMQKASGPWNQNTRVVIKDWVFAVGTDDGGPGAAALPDYDDYGN